MTVDQCAYEIFGADERMLDLAMALRGPRRGGRVFIAFTDWEARWARTGDGARVHFHAVVTLPLWRPPRIDMGDMLARWTRFLDAVALHERGHLAIGLAAARSLAAALDVQPHGGAWADVARAIVEPYLELERRYDVETRHGATQGAVLRSEG